MIPLMKVAMSDKALRMLGETLYSGAITEGPRVKEFEEALGSYLNKDVLTVNSCTSGIALALHLEDVGAGDEVICPRLTCTATNLHVKHRGATIVWSDMDEVTGNADIDSIVDRVSEKTKAIIVIDWSGRPLNVKALRAKLPRPIPIIRDAAHSFMPVTEEFDADYIVWSFQAVKFLSCGDGGALSVPSTKTERARRLRWFGIDRDKSAKYRFLQDIAEAGYKFHMNDISATLGLANLELAKDNIRKHRENAAAIYGGLGASNSSFSYPDYDINGSYWFFPVFSCKSKGDVDVDEFFHSRGVQISPVHGDNADYSCFDAPVSESLNRHWGVPCGWWMNSADLVNVVSACNEWSTKSR